MEGQHPGKDVRTIHPSEVDCAEDASCPVERQLQTEISRPGALAGLSLAFPGPSLNASSNSLCYRKSDKAKFHTKRRRVPHSLLLRVSCLGLISFDFMAHALDTFLHAMCSLLDSVTSRT